jgi:L-seryl-tRNA(Ser) seleniumtransferase
MPTADHVLNRREFLSAAVVAGYALADPAVGAASTAVPASGAAPGAVSTLLAPAPGTANTAHSLADNVYTRLLGVRPHLGAHEHISRLGGGRMSREVLDAMAEANEYFVDMRELNAAAGKRAAHLLGVESALVTAGGFSGLILGAAACLTGTDEEKVNALPHPTWERRECLIQTAQKFDYDRAYRTAGATIVYADTKTDLEARLGSRTAFVAILSASERQGQFGPPFEAIGAPKPSAALVRHEELIAMAKRAGVPVLVDMASDLPPWNQLDRFLKAGADLLVLSGGKAIGGPQSSGLLLGRRDLIDAARLHSTPNDNIGRGMKVGKEEIVGLVAALERYVKTDHVADMERWNARARRIAERLQGIRGLRATYALNTAGYGDADLTWDEKDIALSRDTLRRALAEGSPRIELEVIITQDRGSTTWHATARTRVLRDGEELLVAKRLREVFEAARVRG